MQSENGKEIISIFELYFTFKGRLGRADYGKYYFVPSIVMAVVLFISLVVFKPPKGDALFSSAPYLSVVIPMFFMSVMAWGKRARDFGSPIWTGIFVFFLLMLVSQLPYLLPETQGLVDAFDKGTSGSALTGVFWFAKGNEGENAYGSPCKVVLFKKAKKL